MLGLALLVAMGGVGWAMRDRAARQARAAYDLELALDRAELLLDQGKRAEASAAFDRAEMLAPDAAHDPARDERRAALKERLAADARDQEFIARFEEIRLRVESLVDVQENRFSEQAAFPEIREALRQYGIAIGELAPAEAAARIQARPEPARRSLVAAFGECLLIQAIKKDDAQTRQWLIDALNAADDDAWRLRMRKAVAGADWKSLEQLAREADVSKQPPNFLLMAARILPNEMKSTRLELLRRIQRAYPADLGANNYLAEELFHMGQPAEAIRYLTVLVALRPDNPGLYLNRGSALSSLGEVDEAIKDYRQSLALAPRYAAAHANLGSAQSPSWPRVCKPPTVTTPPAPRRWPAVARARTPTRSTTSSAPTCAGRHWTGCGPT